MAEDTRARTTWGALLDCAPNFDALLFNPNDDETWMETETDPLRRAIAFFNGFAGEVSNGGVAQYFSNGGDGPEFRQAPAAVRRHPQLQDVADLMDEAFRRKELGAADVNSAKHNEFNARAWPVLAAARKRILLDIMTRPAVYLIIEPQPGLTHEGVEYADVPGQFGTWRARFVDGFPIGPNIREQGERISVVRFSSSRTHVEYDINLGDQDVIRGWEDFATGLSGERELKGGKLSRLDVRADNQATYRYSDRFDDKGRSTNAELAVRGISFYVHNRFLAESPFHLFRSARDGVNFHRTYFANGQVNAERVDVDDNNFRYTASFDKEGKDLAPKGKGELRLLNRVTEHGEERSTAKLVDGKLDGRLVATKADGSVAYETNWRRGKMIENK